MKTLHLVFVIGLTGLSVAVSSCSKETLGNNNMQTALSGNSGNPAETMYQVNIQSGKFDPATLYALPGHKVTWKNLDGVVHTVTSDDATIFNSSNINPGSTYSLITGATGTYPYHCSIHPAERAVLNVVAR